MSDELNEEALRYHRNSPVGKLEVVATKPLANQHDLALAYSPGVAAACQEIVRDPSEASTVTARANLVAVVTNGTAVLGLGAIGPLASKPVMEGKAVLFKKFAGIDVFDIEIDERDPQKLIDIVASLEPTFGGINLEDIKAPECFFVERELRKKMKIPVFHDDQHGTAIIANTAVLNGLRLVNKRIETVQVVASGAGAAALACLDLLVCMGVKLQNILVVDRKGVIYHGRSDNLDASKIRFARETDARTLDDAINGADIFLGLSGPGLLKPDMVKRMAPNPIILALANPIPEILPDQAKAVRDDVIIATGRSDYPNQVNNVLCFPYIFRGALDVGATVINAEMEIACVYALAELARAEVSDVVAQAYGGQVPKFGPEYLIPKPFDPRLITTVAPAVAKAAMDSGVASHSIDDLDAYREHLSMFVIRSGFVMKPVFDQAKETTKRLVFAEGEDQRVLQAAQQLIDDGIAKPILVGRPKVVDECLNRLGLGIQAGKDFELVDPCSDSWSHELTACHGTLPGAAKTGVGAQNTVIAALMLQRNEADAMLCGTEGVFTHHLGHILNIIGKAPSIRDVSTVTALVLPSGTFFICDSHVTPDPCAEEIAEMTVLAADQVRRFGISPKVALLSHSNFGSHNNPSALKMREALSILRQRAPELDVEGEMHGDSALSGEIRARLLRDSRLKGQANLFVMPNIDAAHIAYSLLKMLGGGVSIGPILIGAAQPAHVVSESITVRGLVNMSAIAVVGAPSR